LLGVGVDTARLFDDPDYAVWAFMLVEQVGEAREEMASELERTMKAHG
jgi:hypothetical protein